MKTKINYNYQTLILLLLWVSGMVKPFVIAYIANVDIVLLGLLIAALDTIFQVATKFRLPSRQYLFTFFLLVVLYFYIVLSLIYTPSKAYAYEKALNFIPNLVFFLYSFTLKKVNVRLLIKWYCFILIPLSFYFVYMKSIVWDVDNDATRIFKDLRNNYLAIGFHLGLLLFLCYYYYRKIWLMGILFFLLLASSARGALIFTIFTFLFLEFSYIKSIKFKKKPLQIGLATIGLVVAVSFVFRDKVMHLLANSLGRLAVLFSGRGNSSLERIKSMSFALTSSFDTIFVFLFGHGIGSFGIIYMGIDARAYPHNLFLELFFELGIIGLLLICCIICTTFYFALKGEKILLILLLFCFLNAMKSSNLTDLWILFSIIGLCLNHRNKMYLR